MVLIVDITELRADFFAAPYTTPSSPELAREEKDARRLISEGTFPDPSEFFNMVQSWCLINTLREFELSELYARMLYDNFELVFNSTAKIFYASFTDEFVPAVRAVATELDEKGGIELMRLVYYSVENVAQKAEKALTGEVGVGSEVLGGMVLSAAFNGVGEWRL